jgi:hypothetical protein
MRLPAKWFLFFDCGSLTATKAMVDCSILIRANKLQQA